MEDQKSTWSGIATIWSLSGNHHLPKSPCFSQPSGSDQMLGRLATLDRFLCCAVASRLLPVEYDCDFFFSDYIQGNLRSPLRSTQNAPRLRKHPSPPNLETRHRVLCNQTAKSVSITVLIITSLSTRLKSASIFEGF